MMHVTTNTTPSSQTDQGGRMASLIQEQARLLKHFEDSARAAQVTETFVDVDVSMLMKDAEMIREQQRLYSSFQANKPSSLKAGKDKVTRYHQDTVQHLENGQKIRMKGMGNVYQSIGQGCAALVQCPNCATLLQVDKNSSKAVYCVMCRQISHVDIMSPSFPVSEDALLAKAMQLQEADAFQIKSKH